MKLVHLYSLKESKRVECLQQNLDFVIQRESKIKNIYFPNITHSNCLSTMLVSLE